MPGKATYDSDPFVYKHMLWRFSLQLRPAQRSYQIKVLLLSPPVASTYDLSAEFKVHCMLRPSYVKKCDKLFPVGPKQNNCAVVADFISVADLIQSVSDGKVLISGLLGLTIRPPFPFPTTATTPTKESTAPGSY
jgi:hypothetical protein